MSLSTEAKVGTVTLLGLVMMFAMIFQLGGFSFGENGYPVNAVFGQVSGLKAGNVVRYAGVDVGSVQSVKATPEGVKVRMLVNPNNQIPEGSRYTIGTDGLLGEKYIDIVPPRTYSGFVPPDATVRGEDAPGLDRMIATADKLMADVNKLVNSINEVVGDEKVKASLRETAVNARKITDNLNDFSASLARIAKSNEQDINIMVVNLRETSQNVKDVTARVDKLIANIDNNGQTAQELRETIHNLRQTSIRVEKMAASLEGVVTDPETARNLTETLKNARDASVKANKMLSKVEEIRTEGNFEVLYGTTGQNSAKYQTNAEVRITTSPRDFTIIGVSDVGEKGKLNLQIGKQGSNLSGRAGVIDGEAGVGIDGKIGGNIKLSVDAYDPNDVRVKLRAQYRIAPETFLVGQTTSLNKEKEKTSYLGIRQIF